MTPEKKTICRTAPDPNTEKPVIYQALMSRDGVGRKHHLPVQLGVAYEFVDKRIPYRLPSLDKRRPLLDYRKTLLHDRYSETDYGLRNLLLNLTTSIEGQKRSMADFTDAVTSLKRRKPLRDEKLISLRRYTAMYKYKYYNAESITYKGQKYGERKERELWKRILHFMKNALTEEAKAYWHFRPKPRHWFLLCNVTPSCPMTRYMRDRKPYVKDKVREERLNALLETYFDRQATKSSKPSISKSVASKSITSKSMTLSDDISSMIRPTVKTSSYHEKLKSLDTLVDLDTIFELQPMPKKPVFGSTKAERLILLDQVLKNRPNTTPLVDNAGEIIDSVLRAWRREATFVLKSKRKQKIYIF